ncbi:hypothetical protein ABH968_002239 [Lysinibacillus sp. RC79]
MLPLKNYQFHTTLFGELDVPVDKGLLTTENKFYGNKKTNRMI